MWLMGNDCCGPNFAGMNLDFSSGSLNITTNQRPMRLNATNGEICDSLGNLLFYSNGIYVANANDDTMMNGSGLNPGSFTNNRFNYGLTIPQANLVIPIPENPNQYYLFHETADDDGNTFASYFLYYSIIDMNLDGGLGGIVQKNTVLLNDTLVAGRITSCKHANGRDWWIVVHQFRTNIMYRFLITPTGILGPWQQNLFTYRDNYFGQAIFSPQGDKFAYYDPFTDLDIYSFDRCSGNFYGQIHIDFNDSAAGGGAAFSSSGRYLYVSSQNYIYQFDMQASNIPASQVTIGVYDGFLSNGFVANFYLAALAPDNKIYITCGNSTTDIHVINFPDSVGASCDFCQHCVSLPAFNAATIPNHPNYFLGADGGTVCDSLPTGLAFIKRATDEFLLFPNPALNDIYITVGRENIEKVSLSNSFGQNIPIECDFKSINYLHFDVSKFENGFYYIEIITKKNKISRKFIKN